MKPNILIFFPDGMQAKPLISEGLCQTPNFDRFKQEGLLFKNAYTPSPTCSPARASFMTGLLPHNHGVLQVEHCLDDDQSVLRDKSHWAQLLRNDGYKTGYFGKWHIERSEKLENFGWDNYVIPSSKVYRDEVAKLPKAEDHLDKKIKNYFPGPSGYQKKLHYAITDVSLEDRSDYLATQFACDYLDDIVNKADPWCCMVSYSGPNESMICSREIAERYKLDDIQTPETLRDTLENRPNIYKRDQKIFSSLTPDQWREALLCYYTRITEIDHQFGVLMNKLEELDELKNTIVIIATDHGKYVGEHGLEAHNFGAFEPIYNIPILMKGPGIVRKGSTNAKVGLHDLCPTILDLVGVQKIESSDANSFQTLLRDEKYDSDYRMGFAEYHGTRFNLTQRVLWDGHWKFVWNGFDYDELYDLSKDPNELKNLIDQKEHEEVVKSMMKKVWFYIEKSKDKPLLESHYESTRLAVLGPYLADKEG